MAKKNKIPIAILSTDWHCSDTNIEQVTQYIEEQCKYAQKVGCDDMFGLGDFFNTRPGQKVITLSEFSSILKKIGFYGVNLKAIPGNHDKQNYEDDRSYLDSFEFHPNFDLISIPSKVASINDIDIWMLPYYSDEKWFSCVQDIKSNLNKSNKNVLLSHQSINGSVNNDGSVVSKNISVSDFKEFDLVLLGHYHDTQEISKNIIHLPSLCQNNFGENDNKGFVVLYDDLSIEIIRTSFKRYKKIKIDIDTTSKEDIEKLAKETLQSEEDQYVRFILVGSEQNIKSINSETLISLGIDVKKEVKEIEELLEDSQYHSEIVQYNEQSIVEEFKEFCVLKEENVEDGIKFLNNKLNIQ